MKSLFKISLAILLSLLTLNLSKADSIYLGAGGGYTTENKLLGTKFKNKGAINLMLGYTVALSNKPIAFDLGLEYDIYFKDEVSNGINIATYRNKVLYVTPGVSIFIKDNEASSIFIKFGFGRNKPVIKGNGNVIKLDSTDAWKLKAGYEHVFVGQHAISIAYSYADLDINAKDFAKTIAQEISVAYRYKFSLLK